jgi:hypothetical protein
MKKTLSILLFVLGELLLIYSFNYFNIGHSPDVIKLNIVVSSIVYGLFFLDLFIPWVDLKDKTQKTIGSIGLRWFSTFAYASVAIFIMIYCHLNRPVGISKQLVFQGIALFLFFVGLMFAFSSSEKVEEIYHEEKQNRASIDQVRSAMKKLQRTVANVQMEQVFVQQINQLDEDLRYISPSNNTEAIELDQLLNQGIMDLDIYLKSESSFDYTQIRGIIHNCEITIKERKNVYSN